MVKKYFTREEVLEDYGALFLQEMKFQNEQMAAKKHQKVITDIVESEAQRKKSACEVRIIRPPRQ